MNLDVSEAYSVCLSSVCLCAIDVRDGSAEEGRFLRRLYADDDDV